MHARMRVLVTGGAGYIGSVVVEELVRDGHDVVVFDNLSKGHADAVAPGVELVRAYLRDREAIAATLRRRRVEAVVHMAADSLVGESVTRPDKYYDNNVGAGLCLLDAMLRCEVDRLVFSSTAAVYGEPAKQPIEESDPTIPTNPYGETKLAFERALPWYAAAYGLRFASLRYFNAAGASDRCGELHDPETHLIPLVLQAAAGRRPAVTIFGDDYPTPDGTCIRDYIHVVDLARAHVLALGGLDRGSAIYNLGCGGAGYSVREVIDAARRVTGRDIPVTIGPRRAGDPAVLVASSNKIQQGLGWQPTRGALDDIVASAWRWMLAHGHASADGDHRDIGSHGEHGDRPRPAATSAAR
jgi:UDP-glucose 4-epimerase